MRNKNDANQLNQTGALSLHSSDFRTGGVAMKSEPLDLGGVAIHRPGTIIGKALQSLEEETGEILVLLSLR
jgi:hypothetical protein